MSNGNNATAAKAPYRLTRWAGDFITLGSFSTFAEALDCYRGVVSDRTAQLVNAELAECGRDGLTEDERDQVAAVAYEADRQVAS